MLGDLVVFAILILLLMLVVKYLFGFRLMMGNPGRAAGVTIDRVLHGIILRAVFEKTTNVPYLAGAEIPVTKTLI